MLIPGWNFAENVACHCSLKVVYIDVIEMCASGGRRGCPGRDVCGGALPRALRWPAAERGAGIGPKRVRALPFETQFRTGKKASENHLRNSVSKVAKWRWLWRLGWTRPGQTQPFAGNLAGSPEQTLRWTERTGVGSGAFGGGQNPADRGCSSLGWAEVSIPRILQWNILEIRNLQNMTASTRSSPIKPNQT